MKSFDVLHEGNKVWNEEDGTMSVMFYDVNSDGKKIMCLADDRSIYPASQFDPADWERLEKLRAFYISVADRAAAVNWLQNGGV